MGFHVWRTARRLYIPRRAAACFARTHPTNSAETQVVGDYQGDNPDVPRTRVDVTAQCSAGAAFASHTDTIYIDQPPVASNASVPGHLFTQNFKDGAKYAAIVSIGAAVVFGGLATGGVAWAASAAYGSLANGILSAGLALIDSRLQLHLVPPLETVRLPTGELRCPSSASRPHCRSVQATYRTLIASDAKVLGLADIETVANNRFMTAARAQDADSEVLQLGVSDVYASQLADALNTEVAARQRFATALRKAGMNHRYSAKHTPGRACHREPETPAPRPAGKASKTRRRAERGPPNSLRAPCASLDHRTHATTLAGALTRPVPTSAIASAASSINPVEAAEINEALIRQGNVTGNLLAARAALRRWRLTCSPADRIADLRQASDAAATSAGRNAQVLKAAASAAVNNPFGGLGPGC